MLNDLARRIAMLEKLVYVNTGMLAVIIAMLGGSL